MSQDIIEKLAKIGASAFYDDGVSVGWEHFVKPTKAIIAALADGELNKGALEIAYLAADPLPNSDWDIRNIENAIRTYLQSLVGEK